MAEEPVWTLGINTVAENTTEGESRKYTQTRKWTRGGKLHKYKYYINGNGVISPSCGLFCILLLKMLRGCIFTTVGISQMKMQYGSESFCKAFWVWASQLVCSSLVFWDSNAFPWVALTVNSSVSYKCNFLWNAIVWKMLEKHCRGMQLYFSSRGKFVHVYEQSRPV